MTAHRRGVVWGLGLCVATAAVLTACGRPVAAPAATTPSHQFTLTPSSGPPGTTVTITGYVAAMHSATTGQRSQARFGGDIRFGGLARGLDISANDLHWSTRRPGHFTAAFQVPKTAWLAPSGAQRLTPGPVTVSVRCLGPIAQGCAVGPAQGQATFTVTGPVAAAPAHAYLTFSPAHAVPGQEVAVTGWAPLTNIISGLGPFGYELVWGSSTMQVATIHQNVAGNLFGHFTVPAYVNSQPVATGPVTLTLLYMFMSNKGAVSKGSGTKSLPPEVTLAPTPFAVSAGLSWSAVRSAPVRFSARPSSLSVAGSEVTTPGVNGTSLLAGSPSALTSVPLAGIASQASRLGYPVTGGGTVRVASTHVLASFPQSLFISVDTAPPPYGGGPPIFYSPFYSTDGGGSWHPVPIPPGMTFGSFAGYRAVGPREYALWTKGSTTATEFTANGGATWTSGPLVCPTAGPCLLLGPGPTNNPGMGALVIQTVWRQNHSHQWVQSTQGNIGLAPMQLVGLANGDALLIDSERAYPVEMTTNGGRTWQSVALPNPPGASAQGGGNVYQALMMLPGGSLVGSSLSNAGSPVWNVLSPGASRWRTIPASVLPSDAQGLAVANGRLWWYTPGAGATSPPQVQSASPGSL